MTQQQVTDPLAPFAKEMWQAHQQGADVWALLCKWTPVFCQEIKAGRAPLDEARDRFKDVASRYLDLDGNPTLLDSLIVLLEKADDEFQMNGVEHPIVRGNRELKSIRADQVTMKAISWLWEGHLARGMQEILSGLPDLGKSQIQIQYIACATTGRPWPDGTPGCEPTNVVMLVAEDTKEHTVIPRLLAAGADLKRIRIIEGIKFDKGSRTFQINYDLDLLEDVIRQDQAGLVTIDPITAYFGGKTDQHKAGDVRNQLGPLKELAERVLVVISTITHPAKNASPQALNQFIGSQAFVAVARIGHLVIPERDPETKEPTGRMLFAVAKCNIHQKMASIAYNIMPTTVGYDEGSRAPITSSYISWRETVDITADQALAAGKTKTGRALQEAIEFLKEQLNDGPADVSDLKDAAKGHGISWPTCERAKKELKIIPKKKFGEKAGWTWQLPKAQVIKLVVDNEQSRDFYSNDVPDGPDLDK